MRRHARSRLLAVLLVALVGVAPALAAGADFELLYRQGKGHLKAGRFDAALDAFGQARPLAAGDDEATWQILLALALTHEKRGAAEPALRRYRAFLAASDTEVGRSGRWARRRKIARTSADALETGLLVDRGRVDVHSTPPGASLDLASPPVGLDGPTVTPLTLYLPVGRHELGARLEGHEAASAEVDVTVGATVEVHLTLEPIPPVVPEREPEPEPEVVPEPRLAPEPAPEAEGGPPTLVVEGAPPEVGGLSTAPGWVSIGVGAAALAGGAVFTALAFDDARAMGALDPALGPIDGPKQYAALQGSLERKQTAYVTLYAIGGLLVAGGAAYALIAALSDGDQEPDAALIAAPSPGGAAVFATGRF